MPNDDYDPDYENDEDFEDEEYLPEETTIWERLLGPSAISLSIVALIGGIMAIMIQFTDNELKKVVIASPPEPPIEEEEEPEMDVEEQPVEIPTEETNEILQKDVKVSDHNETADEEDFNEAKGDPNNASMVDFKLQNSLDTLGVGGGGGGRHGNRRGGRENLVKGMGGGRKTENAVLAALRWLKRHQDGSGMWDLANYAGECGKEGKKGKCDGFGLTEYNVGASALSMLAYTGRGYDHVTPGEFKKTVSKGFKYLTKVQKSDGAFGEGEGNFIYNQSLATFAIADLWNMSEDEAKCKPPVEKGVQWLLEAQNEGLAWRYANYKKHPELINEHMAEGGAINDTSVTTWVVMALKTAKECGVKIDEKGYAGATAWLDSVYDGKGYSGPGTFGYTKKLGFVKGRKFGTTACGMLSRQFMKQTAGVSSGAESLLEELPDWHGVRDMYYWYYGSLAMFQLGGDYWTKWNDAMKPALTKNINNKRSKCLFGSWDPYGTSWGEEYGGRIYTTATGALTLEVYYRYLRMGDDGEGKK